MALMALGIILLETTSYMVELLVCMGMERCGCLITVRVYHICIGSLLLMYSAPNSATDNMTFL